MTQNRNPLPSKSQTEALLGFVGRIKAAEPILDSTPAEYPGYLPWWLEFMALASEARFSDPDYQPNRVAQQFENPGSLREADFATWRAALMFVVRQERFSDGFWNTAYRSGIFLVLLERLVELSRHWEGQRLEP